MENIFITEGELDTFKKLITADEEVIYATYGIITYNSRRVYYYWKAPFVFTDRHVFFYQRKGKGSKNEVEILKIPLYRAKFFIRYKHLNIGLLDFRPKYNEKSNETKKEFKTRWKNFPKVLLPYIISNQKDQLKVLNTMKNENPDEFAKEDVKKMPYYGSYKYMEKSIVKSLSKFEKKL